MKEYYKRLFGKDIDIKMARKIRDMLNFLRKYSDLLSQVLSREDVEDVVRMMSKT
jgi:hypothetical protein